MKIPQRICVSCRKKCNKTDLIRISKKDDMPVIDNKKQCSSRGIYVCYSDSCVEKLKKNNAIQRFLKVEPTSQLYNELKSIIEEENFD